MKGIKEEAKQDFIRAKQHFAGENYHQIKKSSGGGGGGAFWDFKIIYDLFPTKKLFFNAVCKILFLKYWIDNLVSNDFYIWYIFLFNL